MLVNDPARLKGDVDSLAQSLFKLSFRLSCYPAHLFRIIKEGIAVR
jgi:hypothetical protein